MWTVRCGDKEQECEFYPQAVRLANIWSSELRMVAKVYSEDREVYVTAEPKQGN